MNRATAIPLGFATIAISAAFVGLMLYAAARYGAWDDAYNQGYIDGFHASGRLDDMAAAGIFVLGILLGLFARWSMMAHKEESAA